MQQPIEPIIMLNVSQAVYERLRDGIIGHRFAPGEQLSVKDLARRLGTSTTPVVQAILRLSEEGLVTVSSRRGSFVADPSEEDIRQLSETREAVEVYAARLAVQHLTDRDLGKLQETLGEWNHELTAQAAAQIGETTGALDERDSLFHCRIVKLSGNPHLYAIYKKIDAQMRAFVRVKLGCYHPAVERAAAQGHARILQGLVERDADAVVRAVQAHIWEMHDLYRQEKGGEKGQVSDHGEPGRRRWAPDQSEDRIKINVGGG